MQTKSFSIKLILVTLLSIVLSAISNYFLDQYADWRLAIWSIIFFIVSSILLFLLGNKAMKSSSPYSFTRLIVVNVFVKIVLCFSLVAIYFKLYQPDNKYFILPFLIVYLVFTIFESYFLSVQSKTK